MDRRLSEHSAVTLSWLDARIADLSASRGQHELLDTALGGLRETCADVEAAGAPALFIAYPVAVAAAAGAADNAARVALAGISALVFLALDILDDLADGDRQAVWAGRSPGELTLAATTLLSGIVPVLLTRLPVPAATLVRMQGTLAAGLGRMSAGQQTDLALVGSTAPAPALVEASVIGKSGEQLATYCALAAELAGVSAATVADYAELGRCAGTSAQLLSDCNDVLCDPLMRDLAHGARTLPIAWYLQGQRGPDHAAAVALLERARIDLGSRHLARERLRDSGAVRRVLFRAEIYRQRAFAAAIRACPDADRRRPLDRLIRGETTNDTAAHPDES